MQQEEPSRFGFESTAEEVAAGVDLAGKTAVVTGASGGLGAETARVLASRGARVVLAARDTAKAQGVADAIRASTGNAALEVAAVELGSLPSIRAFGAAIAAKHPKIHLLINNAGVMACPLARTEQGFESQFGTNHLGHFALTGLVLDRVVATPDSRIVTVSSVGHKIKSKLDLDVVTSLDGYDRVAAYGRSKLSNLLFTYELQRRLERASTGTMALAAHPGGSVTELARNSPRSIKILATLMKPLMQSAAMGALPTLRAATDPAASGGSYYGPGGIGEVRGHPIVVTSSEHSHDTDLQLRLWELSVELTGVDPSV